MVHRAFLSQGGGSDDLPRFRNTYFPGTRKFKAFPSTNPSATRDYYSSNRFLDDLYTHFIYHVTMVIALVIHRRHGKIPTELLPLDINRQDALKRLQAKIDALNLRNVQEIVIIFKPDENFGYFGQRKYSRKGPVYLHTEGFARTWDFAGEWVRDYVPEDMISSGDQKFERALDALTWMCRYLGGKIRACEERTKKGRKGRGSFETKGTISFTLDAAAKERIDVERIVEVLGFLGRVRQMQVAFKLSEMSWIEARAVEGILRRAVHRNFADAKTLSMFLPFPRLPPELQATVLKWAVRSATPALLHAPDDERRLHLVERQCCGTCRGISHTFSSQTSGAGIQFEKKPSRCCCTTTCYVFKPETFSTSTSNACGCVSSSAPIFAVPLIRFEALRQFCANNSFVAQGDMRAQNEHPRYWYSASDRRTNVWSQIKSIPPDLLPHVKHLTIETDWLLQSLDLNTRAALRWGILYQDNSWGRALRYLQTRGGTKLCVEVRINKFKRRQGGYHDWDGIETRPTPSEQQLVSKERTAFITDVQKLNLNVVVWVMMLKRWLGTLDPGEWEMVLYHKGARRAESAEPA